MVHVGCSLGCFGRNGRVERHPGSRAIEELNMAKKFVRVILEQRLELDAALISSDRRAASRGAYILIMFAHFVKP